MTKQNMKSSETINSSVKDLSWDDILADVREKLFSGDVVPTKERVIAYLFGVYGLDCEYAGGGCSGSDWNYRVQITPRGTPRVLHVSGKKGTKPVIDYVERDE